MVIENLYLKAEIIKVIGHPERLKILRLLLDGERCVKDICNELNLPQPKVSQHIGIMKEVGIVKFKRMGTRNIYHIDSEFAETIVKAVFSKDRTI